jgi:hypothetical protein
MSGPPASAHASPPGTSCAVFPADNIWNTDISALPVNAHSAAWLTSTGAASGRLLHPDFGGPPYGIPFNVVNSSHATANFDFQYWQESDPTVPTKQPQGPYPYGSDLVVEAPTDSHLLTIVSDTCKLYETFATNYNGPHTGGSGAIFDLSTNALRPDTWTSAGAAGLPIFPGLVRLDEVQAGAINHAIRFTVQQSDMSHLWPARHDAGSASNPNLPPMGARFRLKAGYDISGFTLQARVVLTAMKHYGLIVADNGSNWFFQGTLDAGWNSEPYATMVSQLKTVPASAFEAVDESSLMVDPTSGQAVPLTPCATASLSPANQSQPAGSTVILTAGSTGCASPLYEFWVRYPSGAWYLKQGWGAGAFNWDTSALAPGTYTVHAWANDQRDSKATWEAYGTSTVTLNGCTSASLSPTAPNQPAGSTVAFTATSGGCLNARFEYWVGLPNGTWVIKRGFTSDPTFSWSTAGLSPGTYPVHVWANHAGDSTASWEAYRSSTVTLTGCTSATLSPPSGSSRVGTSVVFTAGSGGCPNPIYAFWLQYPGGSWYLLQKFTPGVTTWQWNTSGYPKGNYVVHVWANNQSADAGSFETYGSSTWTLT